MTMAQTKREFRGERLRPAAPWKRLALLVVGALTVRFATGQTPTETPTDTPTNTPTATNTPTP